MLVASWQARAIPSPLWSVSTSLFLIFSVFIPSAAQLYTALVSVCWWQDIDEVTVTYPSPLHLLEDLRSMGETHAVSLHLCACCLFFCMQAFLSVSKWSRWVAAHQILFSDGMSCKTLKRTGTIDHEVLVAASAIYQGLFQDTFPPCVCVCVFLSLCSWLLVDWPPLCTMIAMYGKPDGTVPATFQIIHMVGWKPDPSQVWCDVMRCDMIWCDMWSYLTPFFTLNDLS